MRHFQRAFPAVLVFISGSAAATERPVIRITARSIQLEGTGEIPLVNGAVPKANRSSGGFLIEELYADLSRVVDEADRQRKMTERLYFGPQFLAIDVVADPAVSFALASQVMYTAGQARFSTFYFTVRVRGTARTVRVDAPAIGPTGEIGGEKPDLNLVLTITDKAYYLAGASGQLGTIPVIERRTSCAEHGGKHPQPRTRNTGRRPCLTTAGAVPYWVYDDASLRAKMTEIKKAHPKERLMIVSAEPDVDLEVVVNAIVVAAEVRVDGAAQSFNRFFLSPGLM